MCSLNSAFDSEKDLPFCEQQQCDQENETNRWTDQSHAEKFTRAPKDNVTWSLQLHANPVISVPCYLG